MHGCAVLSEDNSLQKGPLKQARGARWMFDLSCFPGTQTQGAVFSTETVNGDAE